MIELVKKYRMLILAIILIIANFAFLRYTELQEIKQATVLENISDYNEGDFLAVEEVDALKAYEQEKVSLTAQPQVVEVPVYVCGEVEKVGVYVIKDSAIIQDVIQLAGGMTESADKNQINLAKKITPNEKIYIPKKGEQIDKIINSYDNINNQDLKSEHKVNINYATDEQLASLPGIGQVKAQQIISYREEVGLFKNCQELKDVSGIGDKTYSILENRITIE